MHGAPVRASEVEQMATSSSAFTAGIFRINRFDTEAHWSAGLSAILFS
jgi:hypothetical protein